MGSDDEYDYDLLVVGSGPAGLAAGIAAGRRGFEAVLFERESVGGELVNRHTIENLPGHPETTGPELRSTLVDQLGEVGGQVRLAAVDDVRRADEGSRGFAVDTTEGTYDARTVVVATGSRPIRLDVPDAEAYRGRGVFYCAMCDGPLYAGETVAVSGSDEWALADARYLTEHADRVVVVEEGSQLAAGEAFRERIAEHPDVEVRTDTEIRGVDGEDVLERLELFDRTEDAEYVEAVDGLYVQHGVEPAASFLPEWVPRTDCGAIAVDQSLETAEPGLFAAGDVRQSSPRTIATSLADGVTVCRSAARYLEK
ncbi:NAD(P)/FAD-dependent oxidoreductase [Natronolimnohabitans innermongolicus]|uniref:FAD-dependent pyridine nucleotide-disulfide oxidoreductase n=1 Tax=Natronolimnohabitans innermongolicus JCM 12255 TaxID=1227499 RepID=L9WZZ7_9EURY|nr:FAD-dependent oxidoreductase [Natronolimnohabitans innermongolicus]ELY54776.1 FAD-dependent pyridine nucleotide-disulfide oxidoreductase [Natronolimnohabitans innermongolicus JCM 12255]